MGRWVLARVAFGLSLLAILTLQFTPVAYADNCGSLADCFPTTDAAATVTVAVAVLIAIAVLALPQLLETPTTSDSDVPEPLPEPGSPLPLPPVPPAAFDDSENRARREVQTSTIRPPDPRGTWSDVQQSHSSAAQLHEHHPSHGRPSEHHPGPVNPPRHHPPEHYPGSGHPPHHHPPKHHPGPSKLPEYPPILQQPSQPPREVQIPPPHPAEVQAPPSHMTPEVQVARSEPEIQVTPSAAEVQIPRAASELHAPFIPAVGPDTPAETLLGIHHVTAIAGNPQRNLDFYTGLLGLRLVKVTVNFDEPNTYQFYYGDTLGAPGTLLTFLCWPTAQRGSRGTGQVISLSFSVPEGALSYWAEYISLNGITVGGPNPRFVDQILSFFDPDGLQIDLVAHRGAEERSGWNNGPIPPEYAIRGLHSVSISVVRHEYTAALLSEVLGFQQMGEAGNRRRYQTGDGKPGSILDVVSLPTVPGGTIGTGIVHHLGWRTPGNAQQLSWHYRLSNAGLNISPVMDRLYYQSFYCREPGGVLFDIATDTPGFTIDERPEQLGTHLMLPPWLEPQRIQILQSLPPLRPPSFGQGR